MLRKLLIVGGLLSLVCCGGANKQITADMAGLERSLGDIRTRQAEHTSAIAALEEKTRRLAGRIDEIEYLQRSKVGTDIRELKNDLSSLQRLVPPPAIVPAEELSLDEGLVKTIAPTMGELLSDGLTKIRSGKYAAALISIEKALEFGYGQEGTAQLMFWKGVAYDGLGENRKSMAAYSELIGEFPKHPRTALGLLRLASVFVRIGDTRTAKLTLQKLVADFPQAQEAQQAKERIKDLK